MSSKGKKAAAPVWSQEKQNVATAGKYYIKIGDKKGTLKLSGAAKKWKEDPTFTYVSSLRVAGRPGDIERAFAAMGFSADDIRQHIDAGYTAASAAGALAADYAAELADVKGVAKKPAKRAPAAVKAGRSIASYASMVDNATVVGGKPVSPKKKKAPKKAKKTKSPKKAKKSPKKAAKKTKTKSKSPKKTKAKAKAKAKGGKRAAKPLADKIAALSAGKVMDVSGLHVDGSGAKAITAPGSKSKKIAVPGYRMVSDKKNGVKAAAKILGAPAIVDAWDNARKAAAKVAKASKSPSKSPKKSPKKSPAKTLPMSPASTSPRRVPSLPAVQSSPSGLPALPTVRVPTIGSPRGSPRL